jgi:hypothetical protein
MFALFGAILLAACTPAVDEVGEVNSAETSPTNTPAQADTPQQTRNYDDLEIITLLPRDAIPAIDNPKFWTVEEAEGRYQPDELVIGVEFDGAARAYSVPFLSGHEIVNDTVGGRKIAVTW